MGLFLPGGFFVAEKGKIIPNHKVDVGMFHLFFGDVLFELKGYCGRYVVDHRWSTENMSLFVVG